MGYIKYLKNIDTNSKEVKEIRKERLLQLRREPSTLRVEKPTRPDRARSLGYKSKEGFLVVRQKLKRGGRRRPDIKGGRKPSNSGQRKALNKNYQQIAEERVNNKYPNCEVLNSYYVTKDGQHIWYEVILVDRDHPNIYKNTNTSWVKRTKGRVYRGLTSAGRKSRGLRRKGVGSEKTRSKNKG